MKLFAVLLLLLLAAYSLGIVSFDADRQLIDDVVLVREEGGKALQIDFSAPTRIVGSLPEASGDILQIKLSVIAFGQFADNVSLLERFIGFEEGKELHLTDMYYEGNVPGGPFIVMRFSRPVQWELVEGDGLLGMSIVIKESA